MKRTWLWCVATAVLGLAVLIACGGSGGTSEPLRSVAEVAVPAAVAQENGGGKGCSLIGGWITLGDDSYAPWIATNVGSSEASGTGTTVVPVWPKPIEGATIDPRVDLTGAWKRTGGNTFAFTAMGFIRLPSGQPILIAKNVGTQTITDDCNYLTVESTMEVLMLDGETSVAKENVPVMHGHRIVVEQYTPVAE